MASRTDYGRTIDFALGNIDGLSQARVPTRSVVYDPERPIFAEVTSTGAFARIEFTASINVKPNAAGFCCNHTVDV
jgi:hypothetical protein